MRRRDAALGDMVTCLDEIVPELAQGLGLASLGLRARFGGHQANYSPTAWVRIYAPDYSRTAMEGFYIVYLFATNGSAVYLSLNQGHFGVPIECDAAGQRPRGVARPCCGGAQIAQ